MNFRQRSKSRLATAVTVEFPDSCSAFQFLRAMLAVPRMPQRILRSLMSWLFDLTSQMEGRGKQREQGKTTIVGEDHFHQAPDGVRGVHQPRRNPATSSNEHAARGAVVEKQRTTIGPPPLKG